ncbi:DUF3999 domain-containing protein [Pseudomonas sp. 15FMM2]|uniref:DUF3999 domain-containing protein n=1 Tax=Pseudomonas imrae TaxID=2992837 RepID=A0ACC7PCG9_9PSED
MIGQFSVAVVGLCVALSTWAQQAPTDFAVQVPLTVSGKGPWYRLELPLAVQLSARQANLGDMRVFNAGGEPQAYALAQESVSRSESHRLAAVKWFPLYADDHGSEPTPGVRIESSANGTLVQVQPTTALEAGQNIRRGWLLDASGIKAPLQQLVLDWASERDGFQLFSIEASDDLRHWRSWGEGQVARLAFAGARVEQQEVTLPGQSARYLRLIWKGQPAPMLTAAHVQSASDLPLPLVWSQRLAGSRLKTGEYSWQLPAALNVQRLRVELRQPNSLAPVTLYGRRESNQPWQPLSSGLLYRLTQDGHEVIRDELQLPGQSVQQLKLDVDERGGGLGPDVPTLGFAVRATQLVFLARGEPPFTLAVGNASVKAANLPLATLIPGYDTKRLEDLGQARVDGEWVPESLPAPAAQGPDWKRIGLWAVLLLGVAALAAMAYSLLRKPPANL